MDACGVLRRGSTAIGIITIAAEKPAKLTIAKNKLPWPIFALMAVVSAWSESEIFWSRFPGSTVSAATPR